MATLSRSGALTAALLCVVVLAFNTLFQHLAGGRTASTAALHEALAQMNRTLTTKLDATLLAVNQQRQSPAVSALSTASTGMSGGRTVDEAHADKLALLPSKERRLRAAQLRVNYTLSWMSDVEINLNLRYLLDVNLYLEWGSGGSTFNFAQFAQKKAYSIEHSQPYCDEMEPRLKADPRFANGKLDYRCVAVARGHKGWGLNNAFEEGNYRAFKKYVDEIDRIGVPRFDYVLIDGRARVACAIKALSYVRNNSVVVLHDAYRLKFTYGGVLRFYRTLDMASGDGRQGIIVMRRLPEWAHLEGDHAAVQKILNERAQL